MRPCLCLTQPRTAASGSTLVLTAICRDLLADDQSRCSHREPKGPCEETCLSHPHFLASLPWVWGLRSLLSLSQLFLCSVVLKMCKIVKLPAKKYEL